jgi:adenylate kinase family enzyme
VNYDEKITWSYLADSKFNNLEIEPNGNIPPDFSIDNKIGIEVRRLNKHFNGEPLEKIEFGEVRKIENYILKHKSNKKSEITHPVFISYSRPLKFAKIKEQVKNALNHYEENKTEYFEYNINENFTLVITKGNVRFGSDFEVMMWTDYYKGGFVINDLKNNIIHALKEKEEKVAKYLNEYNEWWLILVNHISTKIRNQELDIIKQEIPLSKIFNKIIILDLNESSESVINWKLTNSK